MNEDEDELRPGVIVTLPELIVTLDKLADVLICETTTDFSDARLAARAPLLPLEDV